MLSGGKIMVELAKRKLEEQNKMTPWGYFYTSSLTTVYDGCLQWYRHSVVSRSLWVNNTAHILGDTHFFNTKQHNFLLPVILFILSLQHTSRHDGPSWRPVMTGRSWRVLRHTARPDGRRDIRHDGSCVAGPVGCKMFVKKALFCNAFSTDGQSWRLVCPRTVVSARQWHNSEQFFRHFSSLLIFLLDCAILTKCVTFYVTFSQT